MSESNRKIIIDAITRMLARREHSKAEIAQKLALKGLSERETATVIREFSEADIQCDRRYTEAKIRSAYARGIGPARIFAELKQHSIDSVLVEGVLRELELDWFSLAIQVRVKKFGSACPTDFHQLQKQRQFLHYRGFNSEQIQEAVSSD